MRVLTASVLLVVGFSTGCARLQADRDAAQKIRPPEPTHPTAAVTEPADGSAPRVQETIARGITVYKAQFCGICHRFTLVGTTGVFGPAHDGFARVAAKRIKDSTYVGHASTAADYVRESIVNPKAYLVPGYRSGRHHMPPYVDLPAEDLEALVQLLLAEE